MDGCSVKKSEWDINSDEGVLLPQTMLEKLLWQTVDTQNLKSAKCRQSEEEWVFWKAMSNY